MNLEALMAAIGEKEACTARKMKAVRNLTSDRELIAKINQNKFSYKTMFKTQSQKAQQQMDLMAKMDQR